MDVTRTLTNFLKDILRYILLLCYTLEQGSQTRVQRWVQNLKKYQILLKKWGLLMTGNGQILALKANWMKKKHHILTRYVAFRALLYKLRPAGHFFHLSAARGAFFQANTALDYILVWDPCFRVRQMILFESELIRITTLSLDKRWKKSKHVLNATAEISIQHWILHIKIHLWFEMKLKQICSNMFPTKNLNHPRQTTS